MNREIKFRAKDKITGDWHLGFYVHDVEWAKHYIFKQHLKGAFWRAVPFEIFPETVGQFTGLKDKNGVDIYEGDIVNILYTDWGSEDDFMTGEVVFEDSQWGVLDKKPNKFGDYVSSYINPGTHGWVQVIGNIHDNPGLLQ